MPLDLCSEPRENYNSTVKYVWKAIKLWDEFQARVGPQNACVRHGNYEYIVDTVTHLRTRASDTGTEGTKGQLRL